MSMRYGSLPGVTNHYGTTGLGVLGAVIRATTGPSSGPQGAGYLYNDWQDSSDDGKEFRGLIVTPPSAGTFSAYEDGSISLTGAPDGSYSFAYRLYVDGVDLGAATASVLVGSAPAALAAAVGATGAVAHAGTATISASMGQSGGALTADEMRQMFVWVSELARIHGLVAGSPLTVSSSTRHAGGVTQSITEAGGTVTVSRL